MRLFVAAPLPDELREPLRRLMEGIGGSVRWVRPARVHLTIRFLGEVPTDGIEGIAGLLSDVARRHRPFELRAAGTGAFPNVRRPRVLWVGLGPPAEVARLACLRDEFEEGLVGLGLEREVRPFRPHLTIGRVRGPSRSVPVPRVAGIEGADFEARPFPVAEIDLMESRLDAGGTRYHRLHRAPLGAGGDAGAGGSSGTTPPVRAPL